MVISVKRSIGKARRRTPGIFGSREALRIPRSSMEKKTPSQASDCPVCEAPETAACIRITDVPVYCNLLHERREAALSAPRGDMDLRFCGRCGHLFNAAFDPERVDYTGEYENSLHYSGRFQAYAESLARHLIQRHDLRGKTIIEIACGQGDFLELLCTLGGNKGIGFDPGHRPGRGPCVGAGELTFIQGYYSDAYCDYAADLICCRHALEHIHRPGGLLAMLRRVIGERDTALYFEVPNARFTLEDLGIWDLIYEHCGYFSEASLRRVFERHGFRVDGIETVFGGQFLGLHAHPGEGPVPRDSGMDLAPLVARFARNYAEKVGRWRERLLGMRERGRRAVLWGAGSKGVTFMNLLAVGDEIECLIDLNPHKHGRFIPGTGHEVRSPESVAATKPDAVIVMNPLYREEIDADLRRMGLDAEILVDGRS
jgi:hypothetical protein